MTTTRTAPEWTDAEKGEAAGIAHRAAYLTVCPEPPEGWRNSYSYPDPLAAAHLAAHRAMSDYPDWWWGEEAACKAAWMAIARWEQAGRQLLGYEHHVPRLSAASVEHPSPADNPRQRP